MKINKISFPSSMAASYVLKDGPPDSKKLILLLHGFLETAEVIFNKIASILPKDCTILAPNGMFQVEKHINKHDIHRIGHAWYFYDNKAGQYFVFYDHPSQYIKGLVQKLGFSHFKKIIIGYSQGGYLAPFAACELDNIEQVIGLGCNFKQELLTSPLPFQIDGIHGDHDLIVNHDDAQKAHAKLIAKGARGVFTSLPGIGHKLNDSFLESIIKTMRWS